MTEKISSVIAREDNGNIQITFSIPFSIIKTSKEEVTKELAKNVEIPGFRRGMAPIEKAAVKIPEAKIIEHALGHILPKALSESVTQNKLKIAIYPKFELISAKENEVWQIRGITCELPEVDLGDYQKYLSGKPEEKKELTPDQKEQEVLKTLLENVKIKVPQILIEEEADGRLSALLSRLEKLGLALEGYLSTINKKTEDLRADYAKQASDAISIDLILAKAAEVENVSASEKEIEEAYNISKATKGASLPKEEEEREKAFIASILKRRKALETLKSYFN